MSLAESFRDGRLALRWEIRAIIALGMPNRRIAFMVQIVVRRLSAIGSNDEGFPPRGSMWLAFLTWFENSGFCSGAKRWRSTLRLEGR